jgi:hypothetical protein
MTKQSYNIHWVSSDQQIPTNHSIISQQVLEIYLGQALADNSYGMLLQGVPPDPLSLGPSRLTSH